MFVTGVCFQSPFPSTLLPLSWVPASCRGAVRCQSPPVSPCPAAACDGGAEGLKISEEGCVCVFQYSSQPLRFLPWCRASETSWPAAHFLLTAQTHTAGALASRGALRGSKPPAGRGATHQLHLGPQSFQDPVGSLRLLLQGGKAKRREREKGGEKSYFCCCLQPQPSAPAPHLCQNPFPNKSLQATGSGSSSYPSTPLGASQHPKKPPKALPKPVLAPQPRAPPALELLNRARYLGAAAVRGGGRASPHAHRAALSRIHRSASM